MLDHLGKSVFFSTLLTWVSRLWLPTSLIGQEVDHGD